MRLACRFRIVKREGPVRGVTNDTEGTLTRGVRVGTWVFMGSGVVRT